MDQANGRFYEDIRNALRDGRTDEAIASLEAWLGSRPDDEIGLSLYGSALMRAGRGDEAVGIFERATRAHPGSFGAFGDLGFTLANLGRADAAIPVFEQAVTLRPGFYQGWAMLSRLRYESGDISGASDALEQAGRCDPFDREFTAIQAAMRGERFGEAERISRGLLQQLPGYPRAAYVLAHLASKVGAFEEAARILTQALRYFPADVNLRSALVTAREESGDYAGGLDIAKTIVELRPGLAASWLILGRVHGHCGHYEDCLANYDKAMTLAGGKVTEIGNMELLRGHILKILGRHDEGIAAYRASANIVEGNGAAWWGLADMKTFRFTDEDVEAMRKIADDESVKAEQRTQAAFALGKAFEDRQEVDVSFGWYAKGNALRTNVDFDAQTNHGGIQSIKAAYTPETLATQANPIPDGPTPIFIVGLPRSGSTLVEQILASHSAIEGTMELPNLPNVVRRITIDGGRRKLDYPVSMASFSASELAAYGQAFLDETAMYRTDKPYFIDKLPTNFDKVGLIHMILPQAIVIDARRHPLDCGFSCFKQHFAAGHPFSYDLGHIGAYYNAYLEMMDHWDAVLPGKVFLAQYERVVDDTEGAVRALLAHCGVGFEPECLRFFENARPVRTASSEQVRQPIYRKGVGYWKNFDAQLAPLRAALGDATLARFADLPGQPTR